MKIIISSVVIIAILLGGGLVYAHEKQAAFHQEMVKTVKENKSVIFNYIKRDYKKNGNNRKISVIEIDYSKIDHNPMGGINVVAYVNKDAENQDYSLTLGKADGKVFVEGGAGVNFDKIEDQK
ncbi:DUF1310 family protein [Latilactobacillus fuchuensis]|uniref:DUF1310 domain-containing protein n=1 Tax=Latilactobacillus fuchuensis DSM 14340 = JCM 11249 TaxID=1423747 RepID=A0A0R1RYH4_9LACO|nr:DUF1310 family protein [Latilactobacillus fuchuensis]KRL61406.1 hypothetical protein FC69_GL000811 [Latilactobacillus fuchuensis DSM 14340 = JCM 11249]